MIPTASKTVTWDEIVQLAGKGYFGDLLVQAEDEANRGPVTRVTRDPRGIVFKMLWIAGAKSIKGSRTTGWKKLQGDEVVIRHDVTPSLRLDGSLEFTVPGVGEVLVFQKNTGYLEPHQVQLLSEEDVRRSRAWMYNLPLDSGWPVIVKRVLGLGSSGLLDVEDQLRTQEEAQRA